MNFDILIRQMQAEAQRQAIASLLLLALLWGLALLTLYWAIRAGIRDGMRDSADVRRTPARKEPGFGDTEPKG